MDKINVVCLCHLYDLKDFYGKHFTADNPWINLLRPDEVTDSESIHYALAFSPAPQAFSPYPNLKHICSGGAGIDALLSNPSLPPHVSISRIIVAEQAQMIASFALWYIHGWQRQMWQYDKLQSDKQWQPINRTAPSDFPVGILGCGEIGGTLAQVLRALGYPVTAYGSHEREENGISVLSGPQGLHQLAQQSKAVVNLLPLTEATQGILSADFFSSMRDDGILINLGRGPHLVENELIPALDQGRPAMAALDVFMDEPLPIEHPFWEHDKIMITPHIAGDANFQRVAQYIAEGIALFEKGSKPTGLVDRDRGY